MAKVIIHIIDQSQAQVVAGIGDGGVVINRPGLDGHGIEAEFRTDAERIDIINGRGDVGVDDGIFLTALQAEGQENQRAQGAGKAGFGVSQGLDF